MKHTKIGKVYQVYKVKQSIGIPEKALNIYLIYKDFKSVIINIFKLKEIIYEELKCDNGVH
jgi:hypothetical protein